MYYAEIGGTNIPARNSVATSDSFLANAPAGSELLAGASASPRRSRRPTTCPDVDTAINDGWQAAITGQQDVQEALDEANDTIQSVL